MTTTPPSETGPSAEDLVTEWLKAPWVRDPVPPGRDPREGAVGMLIMTKEHKRDLIRRIDAALSGAKRSAHLEDARAGCVYCAGRWAALFRSEPVTNTLAWGKTWVHMNVNHDDDSVECTRPEVWDALSLLPGGQK